MKRLYQQYLLPGVIFQSVLIGGAYATGREIVEYGAKFGGFGLWSVAAIGIGFALMTAICYEFVRVTGAFDYRSLVRELIGPAWPLFDVLYVAMAVVVIAVVSAATGSVGERVLGMPYWLGVGLVILLVGIINARGRATIEAFKTVGSALLYLGYAGFAWTVLSRSGPAIGRVLVSGDSSYVTDASLGTVLGTGLLYVGYNLAGLPSTLFALDRHTSRRQAIGAGLITGLLSTIPFVLTFLAVLAFYPDPAVLGAEVPWLEMLERTGGRGLIVFYALVVVWTLVETSVGMIHALIDRISVNRVESGGAVLTPRAAGLISVGLLASAAMLSQLGIIALVAQGYTLMAYGFLALFALPLLTVGVARIYRA
ncbi:MAG TPA: hypothetical protein QGG47_03430 [Acidobacteriota bacterium]|nr:hypothetical protein [Acidobacteriota bacterium]